MVRVDIKVMLETAYDYSPIKAWMSIGRHFSGVPEFKTRRSQLCEYDDAVCALK